MNEQREAGQRRGTRRGEGQEEEREGEDKKDRVEQKRGRED
jgi:hypothetical protein